MMKQKALLVIDVQHGFMKNGTETLVPRISELVRKWPVEDLFYLKYRNYPSSFFTKNLDWAACTTGDDINIVPEVFVQGAKVFDHYGYSPPPELLGILKDYGAIHICGVDTDACVMAAVFSLWDAEIKPVVLEEYCGSSGGEHFHRAALGLMLRQFGAASVLRA